MLATSLKPEFTCSAWMCANVTAMHLNVLRKVEFMKWEGIKKSGNFISSEANLNFTVLQWLKIRLDILAQTWEKAWIANAERYALLTSTANIFTFILHVTNTTVNYIQLHQHMKSNAFHPAAQQSGQKQTGVGFKSPNGSTDIIYADFNHANTPQPGMQRTAISTGAAKQHTVGVLEPHRTCCVWAAKTPAGNALCTPMQACIFGTHYKKEQHSQTCSPVRPLKFTVKVGKAPTLSHSKPEVCCMISLKYLWWWKCVFVQKCCNYAHVWHLFMRILYMLIIHWH